MKLKTYQAYTMAQALGAVKDDLGHDAVILNTRTFKRGGFFGLGRRNIVEVTATPAQEKAAPRPPLRRVDPVRNAARRAYAARLQDPIAPPKPAPSPENGEARSIPEVTTVPGTVPATPVAKPVSVKTDATAVPGTGVPEAAVARRYVLQPTDDMARQVETKPDRPVPGRPAAVAESLSGLDAMQEELGAIRQMVGRVLHRQNTAGPTPQLAGPLFDLHLRLLGQDLDQSLADAVAEKVSRTLDETQRSRAEEVQRCAERLLAEMIPVAGEAVASASPDGRPLVIALIGPTGVGKTTTLAKLAATFKLRGGKRVGLVTADTYRIAAVDQLRTYANIIGLPLQVAMTPADMRQAVHSLCDREVILVDTAGRSQRDRGRLDELRQFIAAAEPHEVHLVLSATADEKVLLQEAEAFAPLGAHKIALSKIDEAVSFGAAVNVVRRTGLPLSFFTTGQEVPDHIERAEARRLAALLLGEVVHG